MEGLLPFVTALPTGEQIPGEMPVPAAGGVRGPLVSCLMVSRGDRPAVARAIECYRRQTYANRELLIVCDRPDNVIESLLAELGDSTIRFHFAAQAVLGDLRNVAVAEAAGPILCSWDDDDLYHPQRIDVQLAALAGRDVVASFFLRWMIWMPARRRLAVTSPRLWEGSILIRREAMVDYPPLRIGEDFEAVQRIRARHPVIGVDAPTAYCYVAHGANTCPGDHFEMLFANASQRFEGEDYDRVLAHLAQAMPVAEVLAAQ